MDFGKEGERQILQYTSIILDRRYMELAIKIGELFTIRAYTIQRMPLVECTASDTLLTDVRL